MNTSTSENPHGPALARDFAALDSALKEVAQVKADLAWFDSLDVAALEATIAHRRATQAQLLQRIQTAEAARAALPAPNSAPSSTATLLLALSPVLAWVGGHASAQARATRQAAHDRNAEYQRLTGVIDDCRGRHAAQAAALATDLDALAQHQVFDRAGAARCLTQARAERDAAERQLEQTIRHHASAEARLAPIATGLREAEAAERELRNRLFEVEDLQRQVAAAPTPAARARIHGACTTRFGTGQPAKVIERLQPQLDGAARTTEKWRERLAIATADASNTIDTLVLDASNLCYRNVGSKRVFLGLAVLDALVPALATRYRVAVVFDKSTQRRLDTTPRALQERFGAAVEVHVAAAARGADHTFLRYADGPTSYVVTNDRLRDFTDLAVVKDGRVLRYNLLDRMIELPALDIATRFQNDGELPTLER